MWIYQGRRQQKRLYFPFPFLRHSSRSSAQPELCSTKDPIHTPFSRTSPCHLTQSGAEMAKRKWAQHSPLSPHQACVSHQKKKKNTLGNNIFINCTPNCSAQPCGTTETFSLPVRWVVLHENWLLQANSINTCHCFLMRQYPALSCTCAGKPGLLSLPCLWWCCTPCLTTLIQTLGEAGSPSRTAVGFEQGRRTVWRKPAVQPNYVNHKFLRAPACAMPGRRHCSQPSPKQFHSEVININHFWVKIPAQVTPQLEK